MKPLANCFALSDQRLVYAVDYELTRQHLSAGNRRRAERITRAVLKWYADEGQVAVSRCCGTSEEVASIKGMATSGIIVGFLLRMFYGWLISQVVEMLIDWLLSPQSAEYRAAVGAKG